MREKKKLHPSMVRLYDIAANHKEKVVGQSALARALNESPQTVKNWEVRGISKSGAIKAQSKFGCDANILLAADMGLVNGESITLLQKKTYPKDSPSSTSVVGDNVITYHAPTNKDAALQEQLLALFTQLDTQGKIDLIGHVSFFVEGRRPHQDGPASGVAGQK